MWGDREGVGFEVSEGPVEAIKSYHEGEFLASYILDEGYGMTQAAYVGAGTPLRRSVAFDARWEPRGLGVAADTAEQYADQVAGVGAWWSSSTARRPRNAT